MASQLPPAAGTRKGPAPRDALLHPPRVVTFTYEETLQLSLLRDLATYGLYFLLRNMVDFEDGTGIVTYAQLMGLNLPPKPERGRRGEPPTYEQLRRMLRNLESVGLVIRDADRNATQGQLRFTLPYPAGKAAEWKKQHAQRNKPQGIAQGHKGR